MDSVNWQVINGNNIDILKEYPDNHFDAIVTDPPYGIEFLGKDWDSNTGAMETWQECFRVLKPGGHMLAFSAARTYHHLATNVEMAGFEIRDQLMWLYASGFPKAQDIGKAIERREGKRVDAKRGTTNTHEGGMKCHKCNKVVAQGIGFKGCVSNEEECPIEYTQKPADNEWAGWKTALKPAHEPIVMARKPMKGSTIDNVLEWGTGALNIDATRVGMMTEAEVKRSGKSTNGMFMKGGVDWSEGKEPEGRYPSNVVGEIPEYQKYFYCPKVSRKERHIGFDELPEPYDRREEGLESAGIQGLKKINGEKNAQGGNNHPTVKPVELMKYLIKLVTPAGGRVLDPFNGSGSTGMACVELGYDYVGCELDPDYVEIANRRISAWEQKFNTPAHNLFED